MPCIKITMRQHFRPEGLGVLVKPFSKSSKMCLPDLLYKNTMILVGGCSGVCVSFYP